MIRPWVESNTMRRVYICIGFSSVDDSAISPICFPTISLIQKQNSTTFSGLSNSSIQRRVLSSRSKNFFMLPGAFALVERSLRIDARTRSTHLLRLGLIAAIYMAFCRAMLNEFLFAAPGLDFFRGIAFLNAIFASVLGIGFFSSVITEEKEEDTLGLMLMAGISPLGILAGKSVGGLWQAMLMIAVQYPFGLLAVTLGGVTQRPLCAPMSSLWPVSACFAQRFHRMARKRRGERRRESPCSFCCLGSPNGCVQNTPVGL